MKHVIAIILIIGIIGIFIQTASASVISVEPSYIQVSPGDTFTINITVDPKGNDVNGAQYSLYFNNKLLEALAQIQGTFLSKDGAQTNVFINETNNTIGRIAYGEARTGTISGVTNPGTLASIAFKVIGTSGTSEQTLDDVKLTNPNAEIIEIEIKDGICSIGKVTDEPVVTDKTVEEAHRMMEEEPEGILLLDVQTEEEYEAEHIDMPNVELKNIPKDELESRVDEIGKTQKIIVYCKKGVNSRTASEILVQHGFESVYNMLGGIEAWRLHKNFPVSSYNFIFDTSSPENPYPSISGIHNGTIIHNHTIVVNKIFTYPCPGTCGHSEYVAFYNTTTGEEIANGTWKGYAADWRNVTFKKPFELQAGTSYNYTLKTGSYPQIVHAKEYNVKGGKITCTSFIDTNGEIYYNWIPAIRLF